MIGVENGNALITATLKSDKSMSDSQLMNVSTPMLQMSGVAVIQQGDTQEVTVMASFDDGQTWEKMNASSLDDHYSEDPTIVSLKEVNGILWATGEKVGTTTLHATAYGDEMLSLDSTVLEGDFCRNIGYVNLPGEWVSEAQSDKFCIGYEKSVLESGPIGDLVSAYGSTSNNPYTATFADAQQLCYMLGLEAIFPNKDDELRMPTSWDALGSIGGWWTNSGLYIDTRSLSGATEEFDFIGKWISIPIPRPSSASIACKYPDVSETWLGR